ncbi:MAG: winged helix-turn-helix transcriptional regulator [Promethearchaeota archaeon]
MVCGVLMAVTRVPKELKNWKEMVELVPAMMSAVRRGLERDLEAEFDPARVQRELSLLQKGFSLFQGKYTLEVVFVLAGHGRLYFNQIRRALPGVNSVTLTSRLKSLEVNGVLERTVHPGRPVRVSYDLTPLGRGVFELLLPALVFYALPEHFSGVESPRRFHKSRTGELEPHTRVPPGGRKTPRV